jgi:hypothetical protein
MSADPEYCRTIEAYLCRKNDGHLIRIVGPSFEMVSGWAEKGVPVRVACRGIDRCVERYYRKGPRRRPVRIEFCEADVLDVFDEWRRAVAVFLDASNHQPSDQTAQSESDAGQSPRTSLPAHLERALARLTAWRSTAHPDLATVVDAMCHELETLQASAKHARGAARQVLVDRLRALDADLVQAARTHAGPAALEKMAAEADAELAPFRARMPREAYERALVACIGRTVRERAGLPVLAFD